MNLGQCLTRVARGPAGGLAVCGASSGTIPPQHVAKVTEKIQSALTALHTRFPLQLKLLTLAVVDGVFEYPLRPEFALSSGSDEIHKFIVDSVEAPYTGDLLAIEHVLAGDNSELPLNDRRDPLSWFTAAFDTLSMAYPITGEQYFVQYRADHAVLDPENPDQKIAMPNSLVDAFLVKIAYELYCNQDGDGAAAKEQTLNAKYESMCAELELRNALNSSIVEDRSDAIRNGGWV